MGFSVTTNIAALQSYNDLNQTQQRLQTSMAQLSSGHRINSSGDDAAGQAISEGWQAQASGIQQAARNAQDGIAFLSTTDGALQQVQSILHRMRDLAVQGANDSNSADARTAIQTEADQLSAELKRMQQNTSFNGTNLLQGGTTLNFQVGSWANSDQSAGTGGDYSNTITIPSTDLAGALSVSGTSFMDTPPGFDVSDNNAANQTIARLDDAIGNISGQQANIGAVENRFSFAIDTLNVAVVNLSAANSRVQDTDMASAMTAFAQQSILQQAGVSMLAQANTSSQAVLKLIQGGTGEQ